MKILRRFLIVALGGLVLLSAAPVQAGPNLSLSESVKSGPAKRSKMISLLLFMHQPVVFSFRAGAASR